MFSELKRFEMEDKVIKVAIIAIVLLAIVWFVKVMLQMFWRKYAKLKKRKVEIVKISNIGTYDNGDKSAALLRPHTNQVKKEDTITVIILDKKHFRRKQIYMSPDGLHVGDQGYLEYKHNIGISFKKISSIQDEKSYYGYCFHFDHK